MKTVLSVPLVLSLLASCGEGPARPLRAGEKNRIRNEVLETAHRLISAFNKADVQGINSYYMQSPEFTAIAYNGTIMDYQKKAADNKAFFNTVNKAIYSTLNESLSIVEDDLVFYTARIRVNVDVNTGEKMIFDKLTISLLWQKTDDQWKIIHYQESSPEPEIRLE